MRNMLCTKGLHYTLRFDCVLNKQYILSEKINLSESSHLKIIYSGLTQDGII